MYNLNLTLTSNGTHYNNDIKYALRHRKILKYQIFPYKILHRLKNHLPPPPPKNLIIHSLTLFSPKTRRINSFALKQVNARLEPKYKLSVGVCLPTPPERRAFKAPTLSLSLSLPERDRPRRRVYMRVYTAAPARIRAGRAQAVRLNV